MIAACLGLAAVLCAPDASLTLDEALHIAERNAFSVRTSQANLERTKRRTDEARGRLGPTLTLQGTYTHIDNAASFGGGPRSLDTTTAQAFVRFPLDIAGVLSRAVGAGRSFEAAAAAGVDAEVNAVRGAVKAAFFQALQAGALVAVYETENQAIRQRLDVTRKRFDADDVPRFDVIRVESELRQSDAALIRARNDVRLAIQRLNNVMARPIDTPTEPVPVREMPRIEKGVADLVVLARETRPEVRGAESRLRGLAGVTQAARGGTLPSIDVGANYTRTINPSPFAVEHQTTGSVQLTYPIYDSGVTRARVAAARQDEEEARVTRDQIELAVELEVRQAVVDLEDAWQQVEVAQSQVDLATEALRLAELRYSEGLGILLDVTSAQADATRARTALVNAEFAYLAAYARLQQAVGLDRLAEPTREGART